MSAGTIRVLIGGALFVHGLAHAMAMGALLAQSLGRRSSSWVSVRSWLFPSLSAQAAATRASPFWLLSTLGFLAASMSFWGVLVPGDIWRQLALGSSIVSILGIAVFSGIWPGSPNPGRSILNTLVALVMNLAVLVTQLGLHWPPQAMFGK